MANEPKTMQDLPDQVIDFLNGLEGFEFNEQFLKKFGLPADKDIDLINLVTDIVLGQTALADLPQELETRLGVPADQAKAAAAEMAGRRLLPISGAVGNVAEQIQNWGGDLAAFQSQSKVVLPKLTAEAFVQGVLKDLNLAMENELLQHRLELILISYAKGVRDQNEAIGTLTRAQKVGGLDMAKEDAEVLLKEIDKKIAFINISFKEAAKDAKVEESAKVKKVQDVKPPVKKFENRTPGGAGSAFGGKVERKKNVAEGFSPPANGTLKGSATSVIVPETEKNEEKKKIEPEVEKMLAQLEQDRKKSKELLEKLENRTPGGAGSAFGGKVETNKKSEIRDEKQDTAAGRDLKVEKEALKRNNGAPERVGKKFEIRKPKFETNNKSEIRNQKPEVDTSLLNKKAKVGLGADVFGTADEEEIKRIASIKAKALAGSSDPETALIEQIIGTVKLDFKDEALVQRFIKAVDSRIRDIRDIYEVRSQLESPIEQGGLGLSGGQLAETVQVIDRLVKDYHAKLQTKAFEKKHEQIKQKKEQEIQAAAAAQAKQELLMAKRYAEITGQASGEAAIGPMTQTSAAMSAEETLTRQEKQINPQKFKQAVMNGQSQPAKGVKMSEQSIPMAGVKPQVQDVRFTRRLAGPVEELRHMGIIEFRRLSTDPQEAIEKVKDKIALVEDQSFEQKIAAIKAWRSSPVNQEYLRLSREALLSGRKIEDLLKEGGEAGLTQTELVAIMKLNSELHF